MGGREEAGKTGWEGGKEVKKEGRKKKAYRQEGKKI